MPDGPDIGRSKGNGGSVLYAFFLYSLSDPFKWFTGGPQVFRVFNLIIAEPTLTRASVDFKAMSSEPAMAGEELD